VFIVIKLCACWLVYEIGVGVQVIREMVQERQCDKFCREWYEKNKDGRIDQSKFPQYFKNPYIPPSLLHANARKQYAEWKEWKGDRFK
jgi:hypothetical protein